MLAQILTHLVTMVDVHVAHRDRGPARLCNGDLQTCPFLPKMQVRRVTTDVVITKLLRYGRGFAKHNADVAVLAHRDTIPVT